MEIKWFEMNGVDLVKVAGESWLLWIQNIWLGLLPFEWRAEMGLCGVKAVKVKHLSLSSLSLGNTDPKEYSFAFISSNGHKSSSKPRPNVAQDFLKVSRVNG